MFILAVALPLLALAILLVMTGRMTWVTAGDDSAECTTVVWGEDGTSAEVDCFYQTYNANELMATNAGLQHTVALDPDSVIYTKVTVSDSGISRVLNLQGAPEAFLAGLMAAIFGVVAVVTQKMLFGTITLYMLSVFAPHVERVKTFLAELAADPGPVVIGPGARAFSALSTGVTYWCMAAVLYTAVCFLKLIHERRVAGEPLLNIRILERIGQARAKIMAASKAEQTVK